MPPPVKVTYRESLVDMGMVFKIKNDSSHHLYNVCVVGRNFEQKSSASVKATEHLRPGETVEVGWLEFDGWIPITGETVEVYSDNYAIPNISIVP